MNLLRNLPIPARVDDTLEVEVHEPSTSTAGFAPPAVYVAASCPNVPSNAKGAVLSRRGVIVRRCLNGESGSTASPSSQKPPETNDGRSCIAQIRLGEVSCVQEGCVCLVKLRASPPLASHSSARLFLEELDGAAATVSGACDGCDAGITSGGESLSA